MADELAVQADQAIQDSAPEESVVEQPEEQSSFFDMSFDDGESVSFRDKDELANWVKESALRQKDYTKKTQTLAEQRRQLEQQKAEQEKQAKEQIEQIKKAKEKWDRYEQALKKRPQLFQQLDRMASQPASPDEIFERSKGYADERYQSLEDEVKQLKEERERERLEKQRNDVYSRLAQKYSDFDERSVNQLLGSLEEGNLEPLLEMAYKASRYSPNGSEEQVLEKLEKKKGARLPAGGGSPPPNKSGPTDIKGAYEQAISDMGLD